MDIKIQTLVFLIVSCLILILLCQFCFSLVICFDCSKQAFQCYLLSLQLNWTFQLFNFYNISLFSLLGPLSIYLGLDNYFELEVKKHAPADTQYLKSWLLNYYCPTCLDLVFMSWITCQPCYYLNPFQPNCSSIRQCKIYLQAVLGVMIYWKDTDLGLGRSTNSCTVCSKFFELLQRRRFVISTRKE